jgi:hypothetical protein
LLGRLHGLLRLAHHGLIHNGRRWAHWHCCSHSIKIKVSKIIW